MRKIPVLLIVALSVIILSGCKQLDVKEQVYRLDNSLRHYGADLRWGRYRDAFRYHITKEGITPDFNLERMENYSITDFIPVEPVVNDEGNLANIPVEIDYYDEQYGTLKKIKYTQVWWFNDDTGRWYIESDFPNFK